MDLKQTIDEYLRALPNWQEHEHGDQWEDLLAGPNDRRRLPTDLAATRQLASEWLAQRDDERRGG